MHSNFVSFLTVQGFFIGFVFSILKAQNIEGILIYTLMITAFFYLSSHFTVSFFIRYSPMRKEYFPRSRHEVDLDYYENENAKREKVIESAHDFLEALEKKYTEPKLKKRRS